MTEATADIGLIGLAVMGQNLVLNMNDHGYTVAVFNRTQAVTDAFLAGPAAGTGIIGTRSIQELVTALKRPRKVMMLVKAGAAVDAIINQVLPLLEPGDVIIDGGNSHYVDTERRRNEVEEKGIYFIGTGVSGGEEGARRGPSIMPGGSPQAWPAVKEIFQNIAAKVEDGEPCCDWVGEGGAGHYVKMVHNGIEYGDMQLIGEAYDLLRRVLGLSHDQMYEVFDRWNRGALDSYLIEITRDIMAFRDEDGEPLVEKILDSAGQKGTGKWTMFSALDLGIPVTLIGEAVMARFLSSMKSVREYASRLLPGPAPSPMDGESGDFVEEISQALYGSKIVSYAQGYMLMRDAAKHHGWNMNFGGIALMWRGGCIIRSRFLGKIREAFDRNPELENLLLDDFFVAVMEESQAGWRSVVATAAKRGVPVPAMSSALAFYDGFRTDRLPANLLQAQRDYFGAHTFERIDRPRGEFHHANWTGQGGEVTSRSYNA